MAAKTKAGTLIDASTTTGRYKLPIKDIAALTLLFVTITGTATLNLEVSDDDVRFFAVATITESSLVVFAIPASVLAINITVNSGTVHATYRTTSLDTIPPQTLLIYNSDTITITNPIEQTVNATAEIARIDNLETIVGAGSGVDFGPGAVTSITVEDGIITAIS